MNQQNPYMFPNFPMPMPPMNDGNWNHPNQCQCNNEINRLENRVSRIERQLQKLENRVNRLENSMIMPLPYGSEQANYTTQNGYQML